MFNRCYGLKEIKGINKFIPNNVEINKSKIFHKINNTIPIIDIKTSPFYFGKSSWKYHRFFKM